jgi:hypothetical protein
MTAPQLRAEWPVMAPRLSSYPPLPARRLEVIPPPVRGHERCACGLVLRLYPGDSAGYAAHRETPEHAALTAAWSR